MEAEPSISDMKFYMREVETRARKLHEAERVYKWFSLEWTKPLMRRLIMNWFCGMLVIVPELTTTTGSPIQFVHEYYGEDSGYPRKEDQTDSGYKKALSCMSSWHVAHAKRILTQQQKVSPLFQICNTLTGISTIWVPKNVTRI